MAQRACFLSKEAVYFEKGSMNFQIERKRQDMKLRMGTRRSALAMIQTELVRDAILEHFPEMEIELVPMSTEGDRNLERSLDSFGGKGVFTQDLERALLAGEIDLAVHSAKDMPMELPAGLALGAVLAREEPADVLVTRTGIPAAELPAGSIIGTSSLRRELQIRRINPQVQIRLLRGNVPTRLDKLRAGEYDGILLAAAGLKRLGMMQPEGLFAEVLDKELFLPAPGQGVMGVEIRRGELAEVMAAIHAPEAAMALRAEREYLTILGGNCNAPCAAYCREEQGRLVMSAMFAQDGKHPIYRHGSVPLPGREQCEGAMADLPADSRMSEKAAGSSEKAAGLPEKDGETGWIKCAQRLAQKLAAQVQMKTVSLVGAGPGDAGLVTWKGLERIRNADVIIYDSLISTSLLNEARLDADLYYAGKQAGHHHMTQEQINELLVEQALLGKQVVRLKGGDPFVFGRGGEEAMTLRKNEIPFEIIPGVSSAYSVPAYAGIPVTDRTKASSFHVITGQEGGHKSSDVLDYEVLAKEEGTLVFLMGLGHLDKICSQLMLHGKDKTTPAALISRGTTAGQKKLVSDLAHIAGQAARSGLPAPAILVVGNVVDLEETLDWFGRGPLAGKRVLVTGTRYIADEIARELHPLGAETVTVSVIESRLMDTEEIRRTLDGLEQYQWMVFTSGNGVELFFQMLRRQKIDLRRLMHLKFAAIGKKTAAALADHGFWCDFVPSRYSGEDLAREWIPTLGKEEKVLMLRAREGSSVLPERLKKAGVPFSDVPLYETWVDVRRREELNRVIRDVDYVTVASSSAARALSGMLEDKSELAAKVISIGPFTTAAAQEAGLVVHGTASEYTAEGIAAVILADARKASSGRMV